MSDDKPNKIIIEGITDTGETFRPSNWNERISEQLSTYNRKHRIKYSPLLQPGTHAGNRCVVLDESLKESNPGLYSSILAFAKNNHLKICDQDDDNESTK